jgi:hypothetical protein
MKATLTEGPGSLRAHPSELPDAATLGPQAVADWIGVSTRELARRIESGAFPMPLRGYGRQTRRWLVGTVRAWLNAQAD